MIRLAEYTKKIEKIVREQTLEEVAQYFDKKHAEKPYQSWHTNVVARRIRNMYKEMYIK